jgi:hypothetical protein
VSEPKVVAATTDQTETVSEPKVVAETTDHTKEGSSREPSTTDTHINSLLDPAKGAIDQDKIDGPGKPRSKTSMVGLSIEIRSTGRVKPRSKTSISTQSTSNCRS